MKGLDHGRKVKHVLAVSRCNPKRVRPLCGSILLDPGSFFRHLLLQFSKSTSTFLLNTTDGCGWLSQCMTTLSAIARASGDSGCENKTKPWDIAPYRLIAPYT